jgi:superfamily II DNA/RNA helicase
VEVNAEVQRFGKDLNIRSACMHGGVSMERSVGILLRDGANGNQFPHVVVVSGSAFLSYHFHLSPHCPCMRPA